MSKIVNAFVESFATKKAEELVAARAEYLALLRRLAREEPAPDDTHERISALLERVGRAPEDFARDVEQLAGLLRLADLARDLPAREARSREARAVFADTREELKRMVREAEERLGALERVHDDAARALTEAHAAREQLLDLVGDRQGYYDRLDDLRAAHEAAEQKDVDELSAEIARVTCALLDLAAFDPFRPRETPQ